MISDFPMGSDWRIWDLHFHTPDSFDYKNKSVTNEEMILSLRGRGVSVVAVTDHHVINPNRVSELQRIGAANSVTVLPGIELRSELGGKESVHFIAIFPEECNVEEIWTQIQSGCGLLPTKVQELGDDAVYCDLRDTAELVHSMGGLVSIHAGSKSNTIEGVSNALSYKQAVKRDVVESVDIFEVGKPADLVAYESKVFPAIGKRFPVIVGSDNHNGNQYEYPMPTWIKADPNFRGLKQIRFEPETRVKIGQSKPEERAPYKVIQAVRFKAPNALNSVFPDKWIWLNPRLNSIIGGKSSGKSLLLYCIAKTLQPQRIDEVNASLVPRLEYDVVEKTEIDFEVRWSDGHVSRLQGGDDKNRPITFIPQTYLNILAERRKGELNQLVENMLQEESLAFEKARAASLEEISEAQALIATKSVEMFQAIERLGVARDELAELGDKKAIAGHIKKIEKEMAQLRADAEFSDEEERNYQKSTKELESATRRESEIKTRVGLLERSKSSAQNFFEHLKDSLWEHVHDEVFDHPYEGTGQTEHDAKQAIEKVTQQIGESVGRLLDAAFNTIQSDRMMLIAAQKKRKETESKLSPYRAKLKNQARYQKLASEVEEEKKQLDSIKRKEAEVSKAGTRVGEAKHGLLNAYSKLFSSYVRIAMEAGRVTVFPRDDRLELTAKVTFDTERFRVNFVEKVDRRTPLSRQCEGVFDSNDDIVFAVDDHVGRIGAILNLLLEGNISLRARVKTEDVVNAVLGDYFGVDFSISQDGDDMLKMSPGKRGIILFQLFLHLSRSTHPLLIDQPEDNLDNRTVYRELNTFLRERRIDRQIIMVSHNPNLVVSTDSDEIIVANQAGQGGAGENKEFQFEYVSGGIECSFVDDTITAVLESRGIREHVCEILEGGEEAFRRREGKYGFTVSHNA